MKVDTLTVGVEVDKKEFDQAIAEIESAFPKVIFSGNVKNVYVNYTQNVFNENKTDCENQTKNN